MIQLSLEAVKSEKLWTKEASLLAMACLCITVMETRSLIEGWLLEELTWRIEEFIGLIRP